MIPKAGHTSTFPNSASGISPSTPSSIYSKIDLGVYFDTPPPPFLTPTHSLDLFNWTLLYNPQNFLLFSISMNPSHHHLLLVHCHSLLMSFPKSKLTPCHLFSMFPPQWYSYSYCSGFRGQFHLWTRIFLESWKIFSFHLCKYCSSIIPFILST